jgi:hypothetical protein
MSDSEWVKIPMTPKFEVNRNGEVRDDKGVIQNWGRTYFLYGGKSSPMRISMIKAMREAFGDESVDNSNAIRVPKNEDS